MRLIDDESESPVSRDSRKLDGQFRAIVLPRAFTGKLPRVPDKRPPSYDRDLHAPLTVFLNSFRCVVSAGIGQRVWSRERAARPVDGGVVNSSMMLVKSCICCPETWGRHDLLGAEMSKPSPKFLPKQVWRPRNSPDSPSPDSPQLLQAFPRSSYAYLLFGATLTTCLSAPAAARGTQFVLRFTVQRSTTHRRANTSAVSLLFRFMVP